MYSKTRKPKGFRATIGRLLGLTKDTPQGSSKSPNLQVTSVLLADASSSISPPLPAKLANINSAVPTSKTNQVQPLNILPVAAGTITKDDENAAWAGLKMILQGIENYPDLLPPLKPLFSALLGCIEALSEVDKRRREYSHLALDLTTTLNSLGQYLRKPGSSGMSQSVQNLINAIQQEIKYVTAKQQRRMISRYAQAIEDGDELVQCYRRIETYFRQLQVDAVMSVWSDTNEQLATMRLDRLLPAMQARYNSAQAVVVRRRMCTPNTRTKILTDIRYWADKPDTPKVYWLNGMAGTGKTTIAYTLSDELKKTCQLGASFFCSGLLPECRDVRRLLPTIAYQMADFSSAFRSALCKVLGDDRDLSSYNIDTQFNKLIRDPLLAVKETLSTNILIVIDALDELSCSGDAPMILDLLFRYTMDLPIKFLVTSRPEPGIREKIISWKIHSHAVLYLHDIEQSLVEADIKTYLKDELESISPSTNQIQQLTTQAGTLFIYAATAVRYIMLDNVSVDPHKRLETMLQMSSKSSTKKYVAIDALYTAIVTRALENPDLEPEEVDDIRLVLHVAICAKEPLSMSTLASLLGLWHERRVTLALQPLRSVLNVYESTGVISTLHASFPDYMLNQTRSGVLYCNKIQVDGMLTEYCFFTMHRMLRFNICQLETSELLDDNVPNLEDRANQVISQELFYSCRYWGSHMLGTDASERLCHLLEQFLLTYLLFWMEVLSLKKCIGRGEAILYDGQKWLEKYGVGSNTYELLKDARKFVTYFAANPTRNSTPHIYISALPFWRKTSPISKNYWKSTQGLVCVDEKVVDRSGSALMATWYDDARVLSVAFSSNGAFIASGCDNGTIRVRDARTGTVSVHFQGHNYGVTSVAFSPDGVCVASGSYDHSIRVWDAQTGTILSGPFQGHTNAVSSVTFSSNGAYIASGSWDNTIRVWDADNGTMVYGPFRGHISGVTSVAFFSDDDRIASGSWDNTIRIWDVQTGSVVSGPFKGHTDEVTSLALSPDGVLIASGSMDHTICVWDVQTATIIAGPIEGHDSLVLSVAFSPEGTRIVSGSNDQTIRVWDVQNGIMVSGPFQGHNGAVSTVAFSLDGARVVSGSDDETIRVWDAQTGTVLAESFQGHIKQVESVAFSPDGTQIVTGDCDCAVIVWDAKTGSLVLGPFKEHTQYVTSVAFSPDGVYIVSGSRDYTILVRDAQTGTITSGPFNGHTHQVTSVAFSPNGAHIVSGSCDRSVRLWDVKTGTTIRDPFEGHTLKVTSVAFSRDGTRIVSGSTDRTIRVWDAQTGETVSGPFNGHTDQVTSVAFSLDGTRIVSGSCDNSVRVWDTQTGATVLGPFEGHTHSVTSIALSPNGAYIVSGSWDKTIRVWDAYTGLEVSSPLLGHTHTVTAVIFSPDGTRIVSTSMDTNIRFWDALQSDTAAINNWRMDDNGWITTGPEKKLIVWVPPELRNGLYWPRSTIVICARGSFKLDFNNNLHGTRWRECYLK